MPAKKPALLPLQGWGDIVPEGPGTTLENARQLPIEVIQTNEHQARQQFDEDALDELRQSIERYGVMEPILVRDRGNDKYEIVAGERRYRAAVQAGLGEVPCIIYKDLDTVEAALLTAEENLQREDLAYTDEARQYTRLLDLLGCSVKELARHLGIDHNRIARLVKIQREAPDLLTAMENGELTLRGALEELQRQADPSYYNPSKTSHGETNSIAGSNVRTSRADLPPVQAGRTPFSWVEQTKRRLSKLQPAHIPGDERQRLVAELRDLEMQAATARRVLEEYGTEA